MKLSLVLIAVASLLVAAGCGNSGSSTGSEAIRHLTAAQVKQHRHQAKKQRHRAKEQRKAERHRAKKLARLAAQRRHLRQRHRLEVRQEHRTQAAAQRVALVEAREQRQAEQAEAAEAPAEEGSECDPNYTGACLKPNVSDYDCEGGDGNGPYYTGEVTVVGVDHYGLDSNNNGIGCEAE